jgi:ABC-type transporter Mla maintaining outer membrane lipid asymmetry permease subunit MlaE
MEKEVVILLGSLGCIAVISIIAGIILALSGYSSSGAFSVAAACVGVLGTLAAQRYRIKNGSNQ